MSEATFRPVRPDDIPRLHRLIERAYRGETAKAGWTHEADLLGGTRTSEAELAGIVADADQVMLAAWEGDVAIACVLVRRQSGRLAYLGMATVSPARQTQGIGRRLLAAAEAEAVRRFESPGIEMTVISTRSELIAWYERRGYVLTGERRPFPAEARDFGDLPERDLEFVVLEKPL